MNRMHIERGLHPLWVASAVLSLAIALLVTVGMGKAQADEQKNFCWGAKLAYNESCGTAPYSDMWAAYASSPNGTVCLQITTTGYVSCAKQINEGVYLGHRKGESGSGRATIINLSPGGRENDRLRDLLAQVVAPRHPGRHAHRGPGPFLLG